MTEKGQPIKKINETQKKVLLKIVHQTLRSHLESGIMPDVNNEDPVLEKKCGAFVTLYRQGILRGCIGHIQADMPMYKAVQEMAISAATLDPRFTPVTINELDDIQVEISLLSPLYRIKVEQVEVGVHGLMVVHKGRRGLLLPRVPVERGWDLDTYLDNLCFKAALATDIWDENPELYAFTAIEFGERE